MKLASIILPGLLVLAGCTTQPEAPKPPKIGLANPASVYCEQKGGSLIAVQTPQGVRSDCKLPGGEVIDGRSGAESIRQRANEIRLALTYPFSQHQRVVLLGVFRRIQ